ncbi:hypothetical protein [Legionella cardiaca]|uniref:Uncharacterized protein n=1 Tax=Legionella cardiaca TaxID=1071983 RepID=A0ABY8AT77_9GAMM|nr:hypothetical protein [Legionella cardiaca]WED43763.1 hypothetical protein PXX05_03000 [Legionella cardiaca]
MGLELLVIKEINSMGVCVCLKPYLSEVITPTLTKEIRNFQNTLLEKYFSSASWEGYFYVIWYSHRGYGHQGRGLDFNFILNSIVNNKEAAFEAYINDLFEVLFLNNIGLGLPLVNCSIIDRAISGISQEFFFLNHINFIKSTSQNNLEEKIHSVELKEITNNLIFPQFIYSNNQFYRFSSFNLKEMRKLIGNTNTSFLDEKSIEKIRIIFDEIKNETIQKIYNIASTNLKLLHRLAKIQTINLKKCSESVNL